MESQGTRHSVNHVAWRHIGARWDACEALGRRQASVYLNPENAYLWFEAGKEKYVQNTGCHLCALVHPGRHC